MKTLLIYPNPSLTSPEKSPALSIFYPGAWAEAAGFDIDYADLRFDNIKLVVKKIREYDVIGISSMTGYQLKEAIYLSKISRMCNKKIIWGGIHASILPEQVLNDNYADYVVVGEGEKVFVDLLKALKATNCNLTENDLSKIRGVAYLNDDGLFKFLTNFDLVTLDNQVYPCTPKNERYFKISARLGHMRLEESRGCPHRCYYCFSSYFYDGKKRVMNTGLWEEFVGRLRAQTGFNFINFGDNIGRSKRRLNDIDFVLKKHNIRAYANMRCDYVDMEIADLLKNSNIDSILFGAESGSDRILRMVLGKGYAHGAEDIKRCAMLMNGTKVLTRYSFMTGLPTEEQEDVEKSLKLAEWIYNTDKNSAITFFVFTPYPGTKVYGDLVSEGLFKPPSKTESWLQLERDGGKTSLENSIYYLAGMAWCGRKGHKTSKNFPGKARFLIAPLEIMASIRMKYRRFELYDLEKIITKKLITWRVNKTIEREKILNEEFID